MCFFCDGSIIGVAEERRRREGSFLTYTTTGHGGDGVGFFYQKEFSLYTRALGVEARGCVSFVTELFFEVAEERRGRGRSFLCKGQARG